MKTELRLAIILVLLIVLICMYMFFRWNEVKERTVLKGAVGEKFYVK